ncbi:hypothetical protein BT63DRAFT_426988 [Microthyrium microscopicum]|uniref:Uncharacterized protein n=1 Tax=Microthyrium microscopicum TaxID=703497 RepID=A0A6A6U6F8_9PEZI|nr:hypothetical protein BT63DRAFT_426988 [Microthyrium microscopicum]
MFGFLSRKKDPLNEPPTAREYLSVQREAPWNNEYSTTLDKPTWEASSSSGSLLYKPSPVYMRPDPATSRRSILSGAQTPSRSPFPPPNRAVSASPLAGQSVLYNESLSGEEFILQRPRRSSLASDEFPIEGHRAPSGQHKRRSTVSSVSPLDEHHYRQPNQASRFSWTNSQAPHTPGQETSRYSVATTASSQPRFRTVESWVGNQASRLDHAQMDRYMQNGVRSGSRSGSRGGTHRPSFSNGQGVAGMHMRYSNAENGGRETPQQYMQHPGTEVPFPKGGRIPSEILDSKIVEREL